MAWMRARISPNLRVAIFALAALAAVLSTHVSAQRADPQRQAPTSRDAIQLSYQDLGYESASVEARPASAYFFSGVFAEPKVPLSQAATNPSVTLFNSSQRARILFDSSFVITLSEDDVAMVASMSANSCTISLVMGMSG